MADYIIIGEIINTHGVKGHVKVSPFTDFPERFKDMKSALIERVDGTFAEYLIEEVYYHKSMVVIKLGGIDDMDVAKGLKGAKIVVDRKELRELPEDSYYIFELIDCEVYEKDEFLGKVENIIETGSNDVYVVKNGERELLIPALGWVVLSVDTENKRIEVKLPEGLREI